MFLCGHISPQIFPSGFSEDKRLQPKKFIHHLHDSLRVALSLIISFRQASEPGEWLRSSGMFFQFPGLL